MKCACFLLMLILLPARARLQDTSTGMFLLKDLSADGLLLKSGWVFYPGDNNNYTKIDYQNKSGFPVNPTLQLDELPRVKEARIGWFVLQLKVDSILQGKTIGMMLSLFGAAEIFLNGERVYKFGNVSADYHQEKTQAFFGRALSLTLGQRETQVLSVRFSHLPQNMYVKTGIAPSCLGITLKTLNGSISSYSALAKRASLWVGIGLTIELASALVTLFFFFSFRSRKEYLYFGVYFCLNFLGMIVMSDLAGVGEAAQITVNQFGVFQILLYLFLITGTLFHLNGIYALLGIKRTRFYKFLFAYAIVALASIFFQPAWARGVPDLFFLLTCFEILPTYYKAARRKFRGAWLLFGSILVCCLFLLAFVIVNNGKDTGWVIVLTACSLLTPALGIVIFLALDFARTSAALKSRIIEVEQLSKQALAQEREKQEFLAAQKEKLETEVQHRTADLRKSLADLKAAQTQLIQSEKMASLGELTAGIAHEIQNPLNFINNFSELSVELSNELKEEVVKSSLKNEQKEGLQNRIEQLVHNQEKIMTHGSRADAIVKNMLQHSRKSDGEKSVTDINALVDEYLLLSYHGLKAKQKDFEATIKTDFDPAVGNISVIPQDIGRVLLNLFNNAFYAVNEKKKHPNGIFEPVVTVSTKREGDQVQIAVHDNGTGMDKKVKEKIFQPFFTTKPAGQGTGLGLSLSYDIVTKGHGGQLDVETEVGEGSRFILTLPAENTKEHQSHTT